MIGSYHSRRSTLVSVASIAVVLLISVGLLYHQRVKDVVQPTFGYDRAPIDQEQIHDDAATPNTSTSQSANAEASTTAATTSAPTDQVPLTTVTITATATSSLSPAEIGEMCDREKASKSKNWTFDPARDSANYGLEDDQCEAAFPDMFLEIDRAKRWRQERFGNITDEDLDLGWRDFGVLRAMIHERQVSSKRLYSGTHGGSNPLPSTAQSLFFLRTSQISRLT